MNQPSVSIAIPSNLIFNCLSNDLKSILIKIQAINPIYKRSQLKLLVNQIMP
jgi:hypothetical protein